MRSDHRAVRGIVKINIKNARAIIMSGKRAKWNLSNNISILSNLSNIIVYEKFIIIA